MNVPRPVFDPRHSNPNNASSSRSTSTSYPHDDTPDFDIASLRARALSSARGSNGGSRNDYHSGSVTPNPFPPDSRDMTSNSNTRPNNGSRGGSVSASIGFGLSKVEISEKEEGEISEEEEIAEPFGPADSVGSVGPSGRGRLDHRSTIQSRYSDGYSQPRRPSSPHSYHPTPYPRPSSFSSTVRAPSPGMRDPRGKTPIRNSPGPLASAPSGKSSLFFFQRFDSCLPLLDISSSEARQYMDIIQNLLQDGHSPEVLVKRGATPRYVSAVCEEIVENTKRRKALWQQGRDMAHANTASPGEQRSVESSGQRQRSASSEVEMLVTVDSDRRDSLSSEGSAEIKLIEKPSPSPPTRPKRLVPSSHWAPNKDIPLAGQKIDASTPPPVKPPVLLVPTHAVRIETYKPPPTGPRLSSSSAPSTRPSLPARPPDASSSASSSPFLPHPLPHPPTSTPRPAKLPPNGPKNARRQHRPPPRNISQVKDSPQEVPILTPTSTASSSTITPTTAIPLQPVATSADAEMEAKDAILEIRRKALESMRRRRAKRVDVTEISLDVDVSIPNSGTGTPLAPSNAERTIEQEVLDLEQEVLGLQAEAQANVEAAAHGANVGQSPTSMIMDLDEPEEGEITQSTLPLFTPQPQPVVSSSLPTLRNTRGIKRPNAEDLDSRPTSAAARVRRRPFGGGPQRPTRLIINLDDPDSSDSEDEQPMMPMPVVPVIPANANGDPVMELLKEKEEKIRLLKEQISARMKAREAKRLKVDSPGSSSRSSPVPMDGSEEPMSNIIGELT